MYRITEYKDKELHITSALSEEIYYEFSQYSEPINKVKETLVIFDILKEEYNDYLKVIGDRKSASIKIIRSINNYLSSYKGFLDRWETYFKREGDNELIEYFKKTVSAVYDRSFEYRFIYNLRNFAQHVDSPISNITFSLDKETVIKMNVEVFINSHSGMQSKFKRELLASKLEEIDVNRAIVTVHNELINIHVQLMNKLLDCTEDILSSASYIVEFYKRHSKYNGDLAIIPQNSVDSIVEISIRPGTANLEQDIVEYNWALVILKSANMKFKFIGKNVGKLNGFPKLIKPDSILEIPKYYTGSKIVEYKGIKWISITKATNLVTKDGYDRLYEVYMPTGLDLAVYQEKINALKEEVETFINQKIK